MPGVRSFAALFACFRMPVLDWIGREAVVGHARRVPLHLLTPDDSALQAALG